MRKQIDELGKLLRDQQALRDDTFRSDQRDRERERAQGRARPREQDENARPDDEGPSGTSTRATTDAKPNAGEAHSRRNRSSKGGSARCATVRPNCSAC